MQRIDYILSLDKKKLRSQPEDTETSQRLEETASTPRVEGERKKAEDHPVEIETLTGLFNSN